MLPEAVAIFNCTSLGRSIMWRYSIKRLEYSYTHSRIYTYKFTRTYFTGNWRERIFLTCN